MTKNIKAPGESLLQRFWDRVEKRGSDECWPFKGHLNHGYGHLYDIRIHEKVGAHRLSWEIHHNRPPPKNLTVPHLCYNRKCCNPRHLALLTNAANASDNAQKRRTHCPKGHPYNAENTCLTPKGGRRCRRCRADGMEKRRRLAGIPKRVLYLTDFQVAEIRSRYAVGGITHRALAAEYGCAHTTIGHIVRLESRTKNYEDF